MAEVTINGGLTIIVDDEIVDIIKSYVNTGTAIYLDKNGDVIVKTHKEKTWGTKLKYEIAGKLTEENKGQVLINVNGNRLDCRVENLKFVTKQERFKILGYNRDKTRPKHPKNVERAEIIETWMDCLRK